MAGGLTISTLNDSSGVLATQNGMSGIAKAWVNFNGSTGSIKASFNVGSITKGGTGNYTVNFTTAMPDANYSCVCTAPAYTNSNGSVHAKIYGSASVGTPNLKTTTQVQVCWMDNGSSYYDCTDYSVAINR